MRHLAFALKKMEPEINPFLKMPVLRNEMHHKGFVKFIGHQLIGVNTVLVQFVPHGRFVRSFHAFIMCLVRSPRATCNYWILFYSVSGYINQRKIINQYGWNSQSVMLYWIIRASFYRSPSAITGGT